MAPAADTRDKQRAAIEGTALLPPDMRGRGERLWQALVGPRLGIENFRPPCLAFVHDARVFEFFDERLFSSVIAGRSEFIAKKGNYNDRTGSLRNSSVALFRLKTYS
jgi:hypothetical protein